MTVGGKLLHIIASERKVGLDRCCSVLVQRDDLDQTVCGNGSTTGRFSARPRLAAVSLIASSLVPAANAAG